MKRAKVILNQDVYNLGEEGDVREVAPGYARNYLIPQGLALKFSNKNLSYFEQRREAIEKRKEQKREEAKSFKERVESKVLELEMPAGNTGKLFGSVNSATIADKLASEGIAVERKKIDVPENSIKMTGEYDVRIRLYSDEVAEIKVIVNPVGGKKVSEASAESRREEKPAAEQTTEAAPKEIIAPAASEEPVVSSEPEEAAASEKAGELEEATASAELSDTTAEGEEASSARDESAGQGESAGRETPEPEAAEEDSR